MNDRNIDAALRALAQNIPKAPESSVERMIRAVKELGAKREALADTPKPDTPKAQSGKDIAPPTGKMTM